MSPDLRHARIFISLMGSDIEKKESLKTLNHAAGWIKKADLNPVPTIPFPLKGQSFTSARALPYANSRLE